MIDLRLVACAVASVVGHVALVRALDSLPPRDEPPPRRTIEVQMVAPPPPPPPPEPPPPEPVPVPEVHEIQPTPQPRPVRPTRIATTATIEAPPTATSATVDGTAKPVFGVTMESTSTGGSTPVPVGNTTAPQPAGPTTTAPGPLAVAAAHEVTKLPLPLGRCAGTYTEAARAAGLEGTVVLDLVVDATGKTRDIVVVDGLGHGLTEAAVAALRACRFTPGEKAGTPVAVRIRGFKIRFMLQD